MAYPFYFGTDPEYFLFQGDKPAPAHLAFGDKYHKTKTVYGHFFRDGYAVELNLAAAYTCRESVAMTAILSLRELQQKMAAKGFAVKALPTVQIDLADMIDAPDDVKQFGCEPSMDAYTVQYKCPPIDAMTHPFRYAGGHLHISVPLLEAFTGTYAWMRDAERVATYIKACDKHLGVPLACMYPSPASWARRQFYGQAGEFRMQQHGKYWDKAQAERMNLLGNTLLRGRYDAAMKFYDGDPPLFVGIEYRTPGPEVWSHPAVGHLGLGIMRDIAMDFPVFEKAHDKGAEEAITRAINTGEGRIAVSGEFAGHYKANTIMTAPKFLPQDGALDLVWKDNYGWSSFCNEHGITRY